MFGSLLPTRKVVFVRLIWAWWRLAGECICDAGTPPRGAPAGRPTNLEMKVQEGFCATAGKRRPQIRFATAQG
jgi:hypothetical protein